MPLKSTTTRYGSVAVTIHWLSAALILVLFVSGFRAGMVTGSAKEALLLVHVPVGIAILVLTITRIAWWAFADRKPDQAEGSPAWQERSARIVHLIFYILMIGMAASGIGMITLSGAGSILIGSAAGPLPDFSNYAPRLPHGLGARLMIGLLVLHIAAALYHQFVRKDGAITRMWYDGAHSGP